MKISELIEKAQAVLDAEGDLEVGTAGFFLDDTDNDELLVDTESMDAGVMEIEVGVKLFCVGDQDAFSDDLNL